MMRPNYSTIRRPNTTTPTTSNTKLYPNTNNKSGATSAKSAPRPMIPLTATSAWVNGNTSIARRNPSPTNSNSNQVPEKMVGSRTTV